MLSNHYRDLLLERHKHVQKANGENVIKTYAKLRRMATIEIDYRFEKAGLAGFFLCPINVILIHHLLNDKLCHK